MVNFNNVEKVSELVNELEQLMSDQIQVTNRLNELDARITQLREQIIPDTMFELNLQQIKLKNGKVLQISEKIFATILKDKYEEGLKWLKENGHEDLIKSEVKVNVGKNEILFNKLVNYLASEGYNFANSQSVHPQTLKAFVREQLKFGTDFPDSFSIAEKRIAELK